MNCLAGVRRRAKKAHASKKGACKCGGLKIRSKKCCKRARRRAR